MYEYFLNKPFSRAGRGRVRGRGGLCCRLGLGAGYGVSNFGTLEGLLRCVRSVPWLVKCFMSWLGKGWGFSFPGASIGPGRRVVRGGLAFCLGVKVRGGMEFVVVYVCIVWMDGWMENDG